MKILTKMLTATILTTLLLTVMGTALAQDPVAEPARKARHHERGDQPMPAVDKMMRGIRHLDLSEEQKTGVKAIMRGLKTEERPLLKQVKADHEQLKELIQAENFDEAAVAALAEKEGALAAERLIIASRAMSEVYGLLTDEQRAELEAMASERAEKRAEKREQWRDNG